jgi:carboxyl-terminal processing protease
MLPASNKGAGINLGFPDVCLTPAPPGPPIPIPYPNVATKAMAVPFSISVKISAVNALNLGSEIPLTDGDQAGVANVTIMGPGRYVIGNLVVVIEGLPGVMLTTPATGNNGNAPVAMVAVPSITNVFFTHAGAAPQGPVDAGALAGTLRDLSRSVAAAPGAPRVLPGGVVTMAIGVFSTGLPAHVYSALQRIGVEGVSALILDLTGCPGGELVSAIELSGDFLDEGAVVVTATDGDGDEKVYRARGERPYRFPLFIVVDGRTASAAELFAGCLQAHGRAVVVGERTYGKGSAQRLVHDLGGPGAPHAPQAAYATVATFTLPDGQPIEGRGVRPDVEVPGGAALEAARALALSSCHEVR